MTLDELRALAVHVDPDTGSTRFASPYWQMAVSLEEAEFLYALVRATRPARVLELGTGLGVSARFIGEALAANGVGTLWTVETDPDIRVHPVGLLDGLPVRVASAPAGLGTSVDLVFIDSGFGRRELDIREWLTNGYAGLVVVDDARRGYEELGLGVGVMVPTAQGMWIGKGQQ